MNNAILKFIPLVLVWFLGEGCNRTTDSDGNQIATMNQTNDTIVSAQLESTESGARFFADTTNLWQYVGQNKSHLNEVLEMEWRMSGQVLHFGSEPMVINPDPEKIDTLFYKQNKNAKWDTLICNIKEPLMYKFIYNACCGGFNVLDENDKPIEGKVNFKFIGKQNHKSFLGTLGESGILVKANVVNTLSPGCRSAMAPNIYSLGFKEIRVCTSTLNCIEEICLYEEGKKDLNYEFRYQAISDKLEIHFIPMSNEPIEVTYNARFDTLSIR
ncbi:MAG TPA: hypothetical protein PLJ60_14380 [Chryseolinea sp.]|nr:hypothetical protein [Chryseolinea sp.]HPM31519.1 hypothetical protein [Chryseolinea sp.]